MASATWSWPGFAWFAPSSKALWGRPDSTPTFFTPSRLHKPKLCFQLQSQCRPLYFISHSLGGIMLKQAGFAELSGIDLPPMATNDAGLLLQKRSLRESEPASLETCSLIAERLGGLPLAIMQMANIIRVRHLPWMNLLNITIMIQGGCRNPPSLGSPNNKL